MRHAWPVAMLAVAILSGCSTNRVLRGPVDETIGQQLIELKHARDAGALSDGEYAQQKRQLIESVC